MMMPAQFAELLKLFKNPLWAGLLGLVLLAKKQPTALHGAIDYLGTFYDFVIQPENAAGLMLVGGAIVAWAKKNGNQGDAFQAAVEAAVERAIREPRSEQRVQGADP